MLHGAVKINRVGATLAVLGAAQRELLRRTDCKDGNNNGRLGTALQQWLPILDRNNRHYTKDHLVWGLLVGGIVPLLYDAAASGENAACVEVGRLGLSAILTVLRGESGYNDMFGTSGSDLVDGSMDVFLGNDELDSDEKSCGQKGFARSVAVHMAALTALSNLLVAAHPVMPRHAGKIMCELVVYLRRLSSVSKSGSGDGGHRGIQRAAVQQLALHAAAIAAVICGDRAMAVLNHIAESEEYDDGVLDTVESIRFHALKVNA